MEGLLSLLQWLQTGFESGPAALAGNVLDRLVHVCACMCAEDKRRVPTPHLNITTLEELNPEV